jgi:hypothetical protein
MDKTEAVLTVQGTIYRFFWQQATRERCTFFVLLLYFYAKSCTTFKKKARAPMIFVNVKLGQVRYLLGKRVLIYQLFFQYVPVFYTYFYLLYPILLWSASFAALQISKWFLDLT